LRYDPLRFRLCSIDLSNFIQHKHSITLLFTESCCWCLSTHNSLNSNNNNNSTNLRTTTSLQTNNSSKPHFFLVRSVNGGARPSGLQSWCQSQSQFQRRASVPCVTFVCIHTWACAHFSIFCPLSQWRGSPFWTLVLVPVAVTVPATGLRAFVTCSVGLRSLLHCFGRTAQVMEGLALVASHSSSQTPSFCGCITVLFWLAAR
jgi:hypothetical protein